MGTEIAIGKVSFRSVCGGGVGGRGGFRVHLKSGFNNCSIVRYQKHKSISKRCMTRQISNLLTFNEVTM